MKGRYHPEVLGSLLIWGIVIVIIIARRTYFLERG